MAGTTTGADRLGKVVDMQDITNGDCDDPDISDWDIDIEGLLVLDKQINGHEHDANRLRWQYGAAMLDSRGDRQRLPKGALHALGEATGNSRRELQYRMAFADKFPTMQDVQCVAHMPWNQIIGQYLTSRKPEPEPHETAKRPGKVLDGFSIMRDADVITEVKAWEHNVFRKASIATWSADSRIEMIRLLKRIADRLQNAGAGS